jgi:hypothetical protein
MKALLSGWRCASRLGSTTHGKRCPQAAAHIIRSQPSILIRVQGIEHRITAKPLLSGDAAITIEIIQEEDFMHRMGEGGLPLKGGKTMGKLNLECLDGFGKAANPFV